jgi:type I restriction enzyme M protein
MTNSESQGSPQQDIPDGKIQDFIDGKFRTDNEVEQVRQNFERTLIEEYRYEKADVGVDEKLRVYEGARQITRKVPLVVYRLSGSTKQISIIIQTASPKAQPSDTKNGTKDLESILIASDHAEFACWTNGIETHFFQKRKQKFDADVFAVNDFPRKGEDASSIYTTDRSRLRAATGNNLLYAFSRCHNYIHANQGGSKEQIFWEFLKLLFAKIEDESRGGRPKFAIRSADERNTREGRKEVKVRVESLFREVKKHSDFKGLFDDVAEGILFNPETVSFVVAQLEKYDFLHSSVDVKGVAYETIVGPTLEGHKGEFFTPRNVVKMTVKMLDPRPGDRIYDPACGTGGFIVLAFNYIAEKLRQRHRSNWKDSTRPNEVEEKKLFDEIHLSGKNIFGTDFNSNLVKTAQMNMIMNNDGRGGLYSVNSLKKMADWNNKEAEEAIQLGSMDFVMANPPFGAKIKIDSEDILEQYDLAHGWSRQGDRWIMDSNVRAAMEPEVLFVERCVKFLKPGRGRLGIVLPDSILGNPGYAYVRYWILQNCQVLASVDLPVETFLPRTGTQTSVLILRRKSEQEKLAENLSGKIKDYPIFMAIAKKVGKDRRGNFIYRQDNHGREIIDRSLYEPFMHSTVIDFLPSVETTGRIVDDELPGIANLFTRFVNENKNGNTPQAL